MIVVASETHGVRLESIGRSEQPHIPSLAGRRKMTKGRLRKIQAAGPLESDPAETSLYCLDIEIDEREGLLRIYDPRAFEAGRVAFCRRMLDAAAARPGFEMAEIDLARASCLLRFDRRRRRPGRWPMSLSTAVEHAAETVTAATGRDGGGRGIPLLGPHRLSDPRRHLALGDARRAARPDPSPPRGASRATAPGSLTSPMPWPHLEGIDALPALRLVPHAHPRSPPRGTDRRAAPGRGRGGPAGLQGRRLDPTGTGDPLHATHSAKPSRSRPARAASCTSPWPAARSR